MTLRDVMTAIALHQLHDWETIVDGQTRLCPGIADGIKRLMGNRYAVSVFTTSRQWIVLQFTAAPSPTNDPLDAELR
jgi:hypothetical protein